VRLLRGEPRVFSCFSYQGLILEAPANYAGLGRNSHLPIISPARISCQLTASYDIVDGQPDPAAVNKEMALASSRIGESLRAARTRKGWSREALAYYSGVSWSAIAQIESGRRREVRLSSLAALADALTVSVDYLIGTAAAMTPSPVDHRALPYGSDDEFLAAAAPLVTDGIERSECVLAVTSNAQIELLRDTLGSDAKHVEFADSTDWYSSAVEATDRCRAFVKKKFEAGAPWIRVVGEPVWAGRSAAEIAAWTRYESMINITFLSMPATIVCPYDTRSLPADILTNAHITHPLVVHDGVATPSPSYRAAEAFLLAAPSER
jgi:transcriptional regulator with XRE-family HTH domain